MIPPKYTHNLARFEFLEFVIEKMGHQGIDRRTAGICATAVLHFLADEKKERGLQRIGDILTYIEQDGGHSRMEFRKSV